MRLISPGIAVGFAGMVSRVLGYVRDVLVANVLGAGPLAEAFLAALRVPNALRRILGEGGLNAALTPLYLRLQLRHGDEAAAGFVRATLGMTAVGLTLLSGILAIGAAAVIYVFAPGLADQPGPFETARWWFVLMTPFIGVSTLASIAIAFLNARRRYFYAAFAPAAVNLVLVLAYLAIPAISADAVLIGSLMAVSLSLGGVLQLILTIAPLMPELRRSAPGWPSRQSLETMASALRLGAPALIATASFQIIGLVATATASWEPGGIARFYYAERLFQLPLSLAGVVIGSVLLTELSASRAADAESDKTRADDMLNYALAFGLALGIPAAAALLALSDAIILILFGHGAFTAEDVQGTALALMAMAPGLPAGIAGRILLQELFAREQSWLSVACGAAGVIAATAAAIVLTPKWGIAGTSAAVAVGLWAQFVALAIVLVLKRWWRPTRLLARQALGQCLATLIMIAAILALRRYFLEELASHGAASRLFLLVAICATGAGAYGVMAWMSGGLPNRGSGQRYAQKI